MKVLFSKQTEDSSVAESWMKSMCPEKQDRVKRIRDKKKKMAVITAHRLLCFALEKTKGIVMGPDDWAEGQFGKPYLKNYSTNFSISYSGGIVMCALDDRPVGADIQKIMPVSDELVRLAMSLEEMSEYVSSQKDRDLFFMIWTLKEAYLKYTGVGLGNLKNVTVYPKGGVIKTNMRNCRFELISGISGYQAAVCSDGCFRILPEFISRDELIYN